PKLAHGRREQVHTPERRAQLRRMQFLIWNRHIEFGVVERRPADEPAVPGCRFIKDNLCSRDTRKLPVSQTACFESDLLQTGQILWCNPCLFPSFKGGLGYPHQLSLGQPWGALYAQPLSVGREGRRCRN